MVHALDSQLPTFDLLGFEPPMFASIELTSKCNLKCGMCALTQGTSSTSHSSVFVDDGVWNSFLDGLGSSVGRVILTGFGEPMLHPHLMRFLGDLQDRRIPYSLSTNGVYVQEDFLRSFKRLTYLDHLNISIDSVDPDIYQRVRRGKISKCSETIKKLVAARGPHTAISVSCVLMKSTLSSLVNAPRTLVELGVRDLIIQSLFDQSPDGINEHIYDMPDAAETIARIEAEAAKYGVTVRFELSERLQLELCAPDAARKLFFDDSRSRGTARACGAAWDTAHVDAGGKVFPCCRAAAIDTAQMGGLPKQSFSTIWNGASFQDFRSSFKGGETVQDVCAKCTAVPSGIPSRAGFQARLLPGLRRSDDGAAVISVANVGTEIWTASKKPCIGVNEPRDRISALYDDTWISKNRVCHVQEGSVLPGENAHFVLPPGLSFAGMPREYFQLVIDGELWLPGTSFSLS
ncbi:radical SAM protein [bacterium]|nr:radical SAM protein [bacterium]